MEWVEIILAHTHCAKKQLSRPPEKPGQRLRIPGDVPITGSKTEYVSFGVSAFPCLVFPLVLAAGGLVDPRNSLNQCSLDMLTGSFANHPLLRNHPGLDTLPEPKSPVGSRNWSAAAACSGTAGTVETPSSAARLR